MRKNQKAVIESWQHGRAKDLRTISTDGVTIFSYSTAIAAKLEDVSIALNITKHSATSSSQQRALEYWASQAGVRVVHVDPDYRGVQGEDLARAAMVKLATR